MSLITKQARGRLLRAGYRIVGTHSAVKTCHWTRQALSRQRFCYKRWYGIRSHRCVQMTPALQCNFRCVFCWRFHDLIPFKEPSKWDEPSFIVEGCIGAQRELLSGFGGNPSTPKRMFEEALAPRHFAVSLDGEPTLYPMLSELIGEIKRREMTAFLVTNGSMPERLAELGNEPTNLYISVCAPDEGTFKRVCCPLVSRAWERLNESLELMKSFSCRKVLRLTLVKGLNLKDAKGYARLILKAEPDFIEPKGFMAVGEARKRLSLASMPTHEEIKGFASELSELTGYVIKEEAPESRVVLLGK